MNILVFWDVMSHLVLIADTLEEQAASIFMFC
jgi:hypothetical protein